MSHIEVSHFRKCKRRNRTKRVHKMMKKNSNTHPHGLKIVQIEKKSAISIPVNKIVLRMHLYQNNSYTLFSWEKLIVRMVCKAKWYSSLANFFKFYELIHFDTKFIWLVKVMWNQNRNESHDTSEILEFFFVYCETIVNQFMCKFSEN